MLSDGMVQVLLISALGMGLVFALLGLLWAMIAVLVRLSADRPDPEPIVIAEAAPADDGAALRRKKRAAVAAVAVALLLGGAAEASQPGRAAGSVSPWQSSMRGRHARERRPMR